jgi:hypothetical protein
LTPPCDEQVPLRVCEQLDFPSLHNETSHFTDGAGGADGAPGDPGGDGKGVGGGITGVGCTVSSPLANTPRHVVLIVAVPLLLCAVINPLLLTVSTLVSSDCQFVQYGVTS